MVVVFFFFLRGGFWNADSVHAYMCTLCTQLIRTAKPSPHHLELPINHHHHHHPPPHPATKKMSHNAPAALSTHFLQLGGDTLTAHLSDSNSIAILSTSPTPTPSLAALSAAFVQAHDTASRMGLGRPLRVTLATSAGTAVIQTATEEDEMLVGTVVAPGERLAEARVASWGVEEVARRFMKSAGEG